MDIKIGMDLTKRVKTVQNENYTWVKKYTGEEETLSPVNQIERYPIFID